MKRPLVIPLLLGSIKEVAGIGDSLVISQT
ncbi:hypothetical protein X729_12190 [Mesorhizobium sp. L103C131B0]|nr:hypothetical protein X729_12190 [Mesorhizobium sp. L103C131B0]